MKKTINNTKEISKHHIHIESKKTGISSQFKGWKKKWRGDQTHKLKTHLFWFWSKNSIESESFCELIQGPFPHNNFSVLLAFYGTKWLWTLLHTVHRPAKRDWHWCSIYTHCFAKLLKHPKSLTSLRDWLHEKKPEILLPLVWELHQI